MANTQEAAREFTGDILEPAQTMLAAEERVPHWPEWCASPEARATVETALAARRGARRLFEDTRTQTIWQSPRTTCKGVRTAIDAGVNPHLEGYVVEVELLYRERDRRG